MPNFLAKRAICVRVVTNYIFSLFSHTKKHLNDWPGLPLWFIIAHANYPGFPLFIPNKVET